MALLRLMLFQTGSLPPLGAFFSPFEGFWQNAEPAQLNKPDISRLKGLTAAANVVFDKREVPHIFASNEQDLYFLQGYFTARHRLWQMDMQARAAGGQLSEVLGVKMLDRDRENRRLGLLYSAENALKAAQADPKSRMILERYTAGVNAWIHQLQPKDYPLEYKMLDFKPEDWTPLKTSLILKYMANLLTGYDTDFEQSNLAKLYSSERVEELFPYFPEAFNPVVEHLPQHSKGPKDATNKTATKTKKRKIEAEASIRAAQTERELGSNNWAISGKLTANGKPILCNDPHLSLNLPSIWYEIQLHAPGINVYGVSIPGTPCVIIGFNEHNAWGITNTAVDVRDWYAITYRNSQKKEYLMDSIWKPLQHRVEAISVRNEDVFYDTVRYTEHGPVCYDERFHKKTEMQDMAMRWTAHQPSNEMMTFYKLNTSKTYADFQNATSHFQSPAQNIVFASAYDTIAIQPTGRFPIRDKNQGRYIQDGTQSAAIWQTYIPTSDLPRELNPERHFVSSANQHPVSTNYPYDLYGYYANYRARRINQRLTEAQNIRITDMMALQNDDYNWGASEALPLLLEALTQVKLNPTDASMVNSLRQWNYENTRNSEAAAYYKAWSDEFLLLLWDEMDSEHRVLPKPNHFETWSYLKRVPNNPFIDNQKTSTKETFNTLAFQSFKNALKKCSSWKTEHPTEEFSWHAFKNTGIWHLTQQEAFSEMNVACSGGEEIVNYSSAKKGASWRMVVSPGSGSDYYGIYPGGQSGNPGSLGYTAFIPKWADGAYFPLLFLQPGKQHKDIAYVLDIRPQ
jgi:penicillin amidase